MVLSLMGGIAAGHAAVDSEASHIRVHLDGISLWATRCDSPLLLDDAIVLARAARIDILIVRFATSLHDDSLVRFDWVSANGSIKPRRGLLPALPFGGGLVLVDPEDPDLRVDVTAHALTVREDLPPLWRAKRELAMAKARAAFSGCFWGGL